MFRSYKTTEVRLLMATLVWHAPMQFLSPGDERAFFHWLEAIPGVVGVRGCGRELHIQLKSKRLSQSALREFIALYSRFDGCLSELAQFVNATNESWFRSPSTDWHDAVFGGATKRKPSRRPPSLSRA